MSYLLTFAFVLVIMAIYMTTGTVDSVDRSVEYRVSAEQMAYYHVAASRVCGTSCSDGTIDPANELSSMRKEKGPMALADPTFTSLAQGDYVITYYTARGDAEQRRQDYAGIAQALKGLREADTNTWYGTYDTSTSKLASIPRIGWVDPKSTTGVAEVVASKQPSIAPLMAQNGAPVLINKRR